jgi:arylsulfatase A-like enzyme
MMGSHRWESKGAPYRNATQVAMGAIGPGFAAGATDQRLAAYIDITATIAAVTGADKPW